MTVTRISDQLSNWLAHRTVNPARKTCRFESYLIHKRIFLQFDRFPSLVDGFEEVA